MGARSLDKGRRAEREVVRRLNRWAFGYWRFGRRGLGHAGVADVVAEPWDAKAPAWPFVVSIKAARAPTTGAMLAALEQGRAWPWWAELVDAAHGPERAWLIWRAGGWWLSCGASWGLALPARMMLLPHGSARAWPLFTMRLAAFLASVTANEVGGALARCAAEETAAAAGKEG